MKGIWPSLNHENKLTWKCKLFGCQNEFLMFWDDSVEKHGFEGKYSKRTIYKQSEIIGCFWRSNFNKLLKCEKEVFPIWECDCEICLK